MSINTTQHDATAAFIVLTQLLHPKALMAIKSITQHCAVVSRDREVHHEHAHQQTVSQSTVSISTTQHDATATFIM